MIISGALDERDPKRLRDPKYRAKVIKELRQCQYEIKRFLLEDNLNDSLRNVKTEDLETLIYGCHHSFSYFISNYRKLRSKGDHIREK